MLNLIHDSLIGAQFNLREKVLGQVRLRQALPTLPGVQAREGERQYYQKLLSKVFSPEEAASIGYVTDVGCRNWSYAGALAEFFNSASLLGVEVDGGRRYWNLHRRRDYADAYAAELRGQGRKAETLFQDFATIRELPDLGAPRSKSGLQNESSDPAAPPQAQEILFCFFFPFVSENPCQKWGLPTRFVKFAELIQKAQALGESENCRRSKDVLHSSRVHAQIQNPSNLRKPTVKTRILSVHQGEWEADEARDVYTELGLTFKESVLGVEEFTKLWPSAFENRIFLL
jgi:hypothetical protein